VSRGATEALPSEGGRASPPLEDGRVVRARRLRASRRSAILAAARRRFALRGYHRTSIDDILAEASIARGTFYLHFESKRAIFDELVASLLATLRGTVRRIDVSAEAAPPTDQLTEMVERVLEALIENREMTGLLLREANGLDEDFDRKLRDFYGRIEALLVSALSTGQGMHLLRPFPPTIAARAVLGMVKETVQWAILDAGVVDVRRLARELIALTLQGLSAKPEA
jgi:AcrR family transcriptional regulator